MKLSVRRLLLPGLTTGLALLVRLAWPSLLPLFDIDAASRAATDGGLALSALVWVTATLLVIRIVRLLFWDGILGGQARHVPRLLIDLVDGLIWLSALLLVTSVVFGISVTGIVTTSGVAVAVLGFATKSLIADLFSGIASTLEGSYKVGDWVDSGGGIGRIQSISWRSTRLQLENGISLLVPNSRMAESTLRVYEDWRDEIEIELGYEVTAYQAERILLSAVADVPDLVKSRPADARIVDFGANGVKWRLRYWVPSYPKRSRLRYRVQRNILKNLHFSGVDTPMPRLRTEFARSAVPPVVRLSTVPAVLARLPIFAGLMPDELTELAAGVQQRLITAATKVVQQGEPGESLFVIKEGALDVSFEDENGVPHVVARLASGSIFGEMSLLTGAPRGATVVALVDSLLLEISKEALQPILKRRQSLAEAMSEVLAERQMENERRLALAAEGIREPPSGDVSLTQMFLGKIRTFFNLASAGA